MKTSYLLASLALNFVMLLVGSLFKVLHWPGGDGLLLLGLVGVGFVVLAFLLKPLLRERGQKNAAQRPETT